MKETSSERMTRLNTTHGFTGTKEHVSWSQVKDRCLNKNNKDYMRYGGAGKGIDEDLAKDFMLFIAEIGWMPKDGKRYTCGRIDADLGYTKGNIRWETCHQQNRNRKGQHKNTSGAPGVWREDNRGSPRFVAGWYTLEGKNIRKCFSIKRLGEDGAFLAACEARRSAILLLNEQGAGYSHHHIPQSLVC